MTDDINPLGETRMPLTDLDLYPGDNPLPRDVRLLLREAADRIKEFQREPRAMAFVPSDYEGGYRILRAVEASAAARGNRFVEWGSGFGVMTGLAAELGFEAYGIEVEDDLVAEARRLADDFGLAAEFVQGSFVPRGGEARVYAGGVYSWLTTEADHAYDDLGLGLDDFDVVYAYPWPDEEEVVGELFHRYAGPGALLVTYGGDGFRVRRKVAGKRKRT